MEAPLEQIDISVSDDIAALFKLLYDHGINSQPEQWQRVIFNIKPSGQFSINFEKDNDDDVATQCDKLGAGPGPMSHHTQGPNYPNFPHLWIFKVCRGACHVCGSVLLWRIAGNMHGQLI